MSSSPSLGVPELAGLASYAGAARIGYSVDENVRRLLRYQWTERRLMTILLAHLTAEPVWEVKCGYALHQWQDAGHVDRLRKRIGEMRNPVPSLERAPEPALDSLLEEAIRSSDAVELLAGAYGVVRAALAEAYRDHLAVTNPLVDHPTRRVLRAALADHEEALVWSERALDALVRADPAAAGRAAGWRSHLQSYLDAAGGIAGTAPEGEPSGRSARGGARPAPRSLPPPRAAQPWVPDFHPRRDRRFTGQHEFEFPPHVVYNDPRAPAEERNLALLAKRTLEMDVPEMMASMLVERAGQPWEFHLDYSRQLWDEMRHAMMGSAAFEARGVDWTKIPLNVGFSLRLNLHATALERQTILFAIEQSLMPAETGKRFEYETAVAAGDPLSAHFHDYDWADEVLHAQIGRRWLKREGITPEEAAERAQGIHQRTWAALDRYREPDARPDWWDDFVRQVLGRPSAVKPEERGELKIIAE
ncbi:MAG TPA: hypothetical protein VGQ17_11140 [Gemmatimonadales bacterium]|nr:hypothetical protein [Gemmatimonadales bacterium]